MIVTWSTSAAWIEVLKKLFPFPFREPGIITYHPGSHPKAHGNVANPSVYTRTIQTVRDLKDLFRQDGTELSPGL